MLFRKRHAKIFNMPLEKYQMLPMIFAILFLKKYAYILNEHYKSIN